MFFVTKTCSGVI